MKQVVSSTCQPGTLSSLNAPGVLAKCTADATSWTTRGRTTPGVGKGVAANFFFAQGQPTDMWPSRSTYLDCDFKYVFVFTPTFDYYSKMGWNHHLFMIACIWAWLCNTLVNFVWLQGGTAFSWLINCCKDSCMCHDQRCDLLEKVGCWYPVARIRKL